MARVTVEDCLERVPNQFSLVLLVVKRAKQLMRGAQATEAAADDNMSVVNALREVAAGNVYYHLDENKGTAEQQVVADLSR